MTDRAEVLMLTGIAWACPDCAEERIFVSPDPAESAARGADFACTACGAAIFIDPCSSSAEPLVATKVLAGSVA